MTDYQVFNSKFKQIKFNIFKQKNPNPYKSKMKPSLLWYSFKKNNLTAIERGFTKQKSK
jgi:hypothetical protein